MAHRGQLPAQGHEAFRPLEDTPALFMQRVRLLVRTSGMTRLFQVPARAGPALRVKALKLSDKQALGKGQSLP
jgi:hypothetical protein